MITIPASSGAVAAYLEQCKTGCQVLSQPLPTSCDGHGSVGESHVRPMEVDIQDAVISSDGGVQDLVRDNETQAAVEVFAMSECSDTESCGEAPQFGRARSRRRLRLVWGDDPQSDAYVHNGRVGRVVATRSSTATTRDLSGSVDRCNVREEKFTQLPNSSGQWPHEWVLSKKEALCPDNCDINSGPRSMCL